jgi:hypothetical protein
MACLRLSNLTIRRSNEGGRRGSPFAKADDTFRLAVHIGGYGSGASLRRRSYRHHSEGPGSLRWQARTQSGTGETVKAAAKLQASEGKFNSFPN